MSDTAARPWWADVQHLRPREDGGDAPSGSHDLPWEAHAPAPIGTEAVHAAAESAVAVLDRPLDDAASLLDVGFDLDDFDFTAPARRFGRVRFGGEDRRPAADDDLFILDEERRERPFAGDDWLALADEVRDSGRFTREAPASDDVAQPAGRRTVELTGYVAAPALEPEAAAAVPTTRHRPRRGPAERIAGRPDRIALWAFILGVVLILVAALSDPSAEAATHAAVLLAP